MGTVVVDQIGRDGELLRDTDTTMSARERTELLLQALPGATVEKYAGVSVVIYENQIILSKQVTYLGIPWETYQKRIQIPKTWLAVHEQAEVSEYTVRFVGVYRYNGTVIFVDFDPTTYVKRKANNSSAHVSTNDLFQAQTFGQFSREDKNRNQLTSVRSDQFEAYLVGGYEEKNPHIKVLDGFSKAFLDGMRIEGLAAVQEMYAANWPDRFQNEWAGFYVEFRLSRHIAERGLSSWVEVQKIKRRGEFDYDLRFLRHGALEHYGDLKASNAAVKDSPGNDAADFYRCLKATGRFWYVIFEHETWHSRDNEDVATMEWNEWRRSVGHIQRDGAYNPLSYRGKYKEAVRFVNVKILEVNQANASMVLGDFQKGFRQPDDSPRAEKVMIKKKDIDNFLIYTMSVETTLTT